VKGWLPPELDAIVASLLAKRPQERPDNARALAKQLRAIAIPDEHAWTAERAEAWWREHRPLPERSAPRMPGAESAERVLVPQREAAPTVGSPVAGPDAPTVEQRVR